MKNLSFMSGLKTMSYQPRLILVIAMMLNAPFNFADEPRNESDVSLEFLEFLGEWETDEGEWIDPEQLKTDIFEELKREISDRDKNVE